MIAEAAFAKSENRGRPSDPVNDWLEAETELDDALAAHCRPADPTQESSAHERMRHGVRRILEKAEETVNAETITQALAKVKAELRQRGEFFPGAIDRAAKAVRHEIAGSLEKLGHKWDDFRISHGELLEDWKDKGSHAFQEWVSHWRDKDRR